MNREEKLHELLHQLGITYSAYEHEPLFTVDQAEEVERNIPGTHCKNLFLKDDKKRMWLIVSNNRATIALKEIAKQVGAPGLRFAQSELLEQYLGVKPGSVTPFGLINDVERAVQVIIDDSLLNADLVSFHPLRNSATLTITPHELLLFVRHLGNSVTLYNLEQHETRPV